MPVQVTQETAAFPGMRTRRGMAADRVSATRVRTVLATRAHPTARIRNASKPSRASRRRRRAGLGPSLSSIKRAGLPPRRPRRARAATQTTPSTATRTRRRPRRRVDARAVRRKESARIPPSRFTPTTRASRPTNVARRGHQRAPSRTGRAAIPAGNPPKSRPSPSPWGAARAARVSRRTGSRDRNGSAPGVDAPLAEHSPRGAAGRARFAPTNHRRRSGPPFASGRTRTRIAPRPLGTPSSTSTTRASSTRAAVRWEAAGAAAPRA
jgi:hypothetical protein